MNVRAHFTAQPDETLDAAILRTLDRLGPGRYRVTYAEVDEEGDGFLSAAVLDASDSLSPSDRTIGARPRLWAIRCTHDDGSSHVGGPFLSDDEVDDAVRAANNDAHGKRYSAETADGVQRGGEQP